MSQTRSLKEERVKLGQLIKANPKQVKQGPVLRGPASLAVFSCGIRLTPLEAVIDGCSLPKTQRNQALVLLVISAAKASIISKLSVVPRLQPRRPRALTEARSHSRLDVVPRGATMARAKEVATVNTRRRRPQRSRRSRMHMQ